MPRNLSLSWRSMLAILAVATCAYASVGTEPPARASGEPAHVRFKRFDVTASVEPRRVGPIAVRIAHLKSNSKRGGVLARLRFKNLSDRTATTDGDFRRSAFAPEGTGDQLLIADEGCGWVINKPGAPVHPGACDTYLDVMQLKPGDHDSREIAAAAGLRGMSPLTAGSYTFRRHINFGFEGEDLPPAADDLQITFTFTPR